MQETCDYPMMRMMQRNKNQIWFVLLLLAAVLLASCKGGTENGKDSTGDRTQSVSDSGSSLGQDTDEPDPGDGSLLLVKNGKTNFSIVTPRSGSQAVLRAANRLSEWFSDAGVAMPVVGDGGNFNKNVPTDTYEILLGRTNRAESRAVTVFLPARGIAQERVVSEKEKSKVIQGWVYDKNKQVLPGVSVKIAGTSIGTSTNVKGWFRITLPIQRGSLEFSFIGLKKQLINFTEKTDTLQIVLEEDLMELEEVTVSTGYYKVDKRHLTSSVTTLKMDDIMQPGVGTLDQMSEGRIPGMIFMQNSGQVGAAPKIKIRGTTTLLGSTHQYSLRMR